MITRAIERLEYLIRIIPPLLYDIDDNMLGNKVSPERWSKKEIIGHLIDSATTNHQRFVCAQFEDKPQIDYDQDKWNRFNYYQQLEKHHIISFWTIYNQHLLEILKRIPNENLKLECWVGKKLLRLEYLINDYLDHLEHHLKQVVDY